MSALGYGDSWGEGDSPRPGERPEDAPAQARWPRASQGWGGVVHLAFRECSARKAEEKVRGSTFGSGRASEVTCAECKEAVP